MDRIVAAWFWEQFDTGSLAVRAQKMRLRADDITLSVGTRDAARDLADEMTAELARRAMEEKAA